MYVKAFTAFVAQKTHLSRLKCRFFSDLSRIQWSIYLSLGTASAIDCLIASSLCYLFYTAKTGFTKTDMTLRTLMRDVITTGCLTSICSVTCIITKALMPDNFVFLGIELLLSTLYVNSYLALLNARYYQGSNRGTHVSQPQSSYVYRQERQVNVSHEISSRISKPDEFQIHDGDSAPENPTFHHVEVRSKTSDSAYIGQRRLQMERALPMEVVVETESIST
ncbi:hypothetical protein K503DRAFT_698130 [Rhizopogon vinicolor AM-OR11-026]|uniref:DUF6534 domain-containing protein n=1 Tax=Rhizopogon vinicolor AM-OR11-026 TaxID=1314800 RepID=A0A1B7MQ96_9AGAM|nr:hypothetical protein K503DRAFT_698130 [Rhizopogon vinicolor AM-OR11-026]